WIPACAGMTADRRFFIPLINKRSSENESAPQNTEFVGRILVSDKHLRFSNLVGYKYPTYYLMNKKVV
ncbi:hypothetical protein ACY2C2_00925, partial [Neisseria meningitidis]